MHAGRFKNKVVIVTGAASGIGAAIAKKFAHDGAKIGLLDMDEHGLRSETLKMTDIGVEALGIKCDVSRETDCKRAIGVFSERFGGIDVLVNNAGITQRSSFIETQIHVYRKVMDINFFGSLYCTKAAIHSLIERKGTIIVIESLAGIVPLLGRTGYCASKHALHGLFSSLRAEMSNSGVHIMLVCPGFVETNLQSRALDGNGRITNHPQSVVGKPSTPERIADSVFIGVAKKKQLMVLTPVGKLSYWISRFAPGLYEQIMARQLKSELKR